MFISNYIISNYDMFFELIGLLLILNLSVHISERMHKVTIAIVVLMFLESIFFCFERWTQTLDELSIFRPVLTASIYSIFPIIMILVMMLIMPGRMKRSELIVLLIPEIISVPLYFTSQWTHFICWFTADNRYVGGPYKRWPYVIFLLYAIVFIVHNVRFFKSYDRMNKFMAAYLISGSFIGAILFLAFDVDKDYAHLFTSAIILYYITIYIYRAKIDPLTYLYNRQSYYKDISEKERHITGVVSIDMNELKYINDNFGHDAGDTAIKTISKIIRLDCGSEGVPYRIGGDEFVIIYRGSTEEHITAAINNMRTSLANTKYSCAFGYAMVSNFKNVEEALVFADSKMYEDKKAIKQRLIDSGQEVHFRE